MTFLFFGELHARLTVPYILDQADSSIESS